MIDYKYIAERERLKMWERKRHEKTYEEYCKEKEDTNTKGYDL